MEIVLESCCYSSVSPFASAKNCTGLEVDCHQCKVSLFTVKVLRFLRKLMEKITSEYLKARSFKNLLACAFMRRELTMTGRDDTPTFCAKNNHGV